MKERTIFREYFGGSPITRVLEFFIENDLYDYNSSDIFRETGVARTTLQFVIKDFLKKDIIIETRKVGRTQMYKLNRENPIVNEIVNLVINIVIKAGDQEALVKAKN